MNNTTNAATTATKLSPAQTRFLAECVRRGAAGYSSHSVNGAHNSYMYASAWHRTAESLRKRGFVNVERAGNGWCARPTSVALALAVV